MNNSSADTIHHNMCALNAYSALSKAFMICPPIMVGIFYPESAVTETSLRVTVINPLCTKFSDSHSINTVSNVSSSNPFLYR